MVSRAALRESELASLERLSKAIARRGPDGEGRFGDKHVALAMRRLAIIDLNGGWQPLYNEDKSVVVVANGEIYNFVELRGMLERRGHQFRTGSDCETIAHLYEEYGVDFVKHLRGMFACAVWDTRRKRLVVARDRVGEKPLYVVEKDGRIAFASELRALVQSGIVPIDLDPAAIVDFFHYGFIPDPATPLRGVRKLPPATRLIIDTDPWLVREERYWRFEEIPAVSGDPVPLIRSELERTIELVVQSDVPVGVCLSAGVDSTAVAALAARRYQGTIQAVSVGFTGTTRQDESLLAAETARTLGTPFHRVTISPEEAAAVFLDVAIARDQPFVDFAGISMYLMMKRCRELGLIVMLSGQGGDELFFGYSLHGRAIAANERKRGAAGIAAYLQLTRPPRSLTLGLEWLKSCAGLRNGVREMYEDRTSPRDEARFWDLTVEFREARERLATIAGPALREAAASRVPYRHAKRAEQERPDLEVMRLFLDIYLCENGLAQADRLSMWHGVELRNPLVDYRLTELAVGLRRSLKGPAPAPKAWLRAAIADVVPPFVLERRKTGFGAPWRDWVNCIAETHGTMLCDGELVKAGILSQSGAEALARRIAPGRFGMPNALALAALWLEAWLRGLSAAAATAAEAISGLAVGIL